MAPDKQRFGAGKGGCQKNQGSQRLAEPLQGAPLSQGRATWERKHQERPLSSQPRADGFGLGVVGLQFQYSLIVASCFGRLQ